MKSKKWFVITATVILAVSVTSSTAFASSLPIKDADISTSVTRSPEISDKVISFNGEQIKMSYDETRTNKTLGSNWLPRL